MEIWRTISEATGYEVSNYGNVRNAITHRMLAKAGGAVTLSDRSGVVRRGVKRLVSLAFDATEGGETWVTCKDAYQYSVSNLGRVMNNKTGRILKPNVNGQVVLMDAGWRVTKTVSKLVRDHFGPQ